MSLPLKGRHRIGRIGWLRAAVLGANDGILSTASLVLGVASAHGTHNSVLVAGVAGLFVELLSLSIERAGHVPVVEPGKPVGLFDQAFRVGVVGSVLGADDYDA